MYLTTFVGAVVFVDVDIDDVEPKQQGDTPNTTKVLLSPLLGCFFLLLCWFAE